MACKSEQGRISVKRILAGILTALILSCGQGNEPQSDRLETVYGALIELGVPGREGDAEKRSALARTIDSLGGEDVVESLLVEEMISDPECWSARIDSLASLIH